MDVREAKALYSRYKNGECTPSEMELVESAIQILQNEGYVLDENELARQQDLRLAALLEQQRRLHVSPERKRWLRPWHWAAAASILIAGAAALFLFRQEHKPLPAAETIVLTDLNPGTNKAILTLSTGKNVNLTDAGSGRVTTEAGTSITKTASGEISYTEQNNGDVSAVTNKITTPRGAQYSLVLADGTKVWLNAASSITFPTTFSSSPIRSISITGECYFEVAHNVHQPFVVRSGTQTVEVLGTHFNVNAYPDEKGITTTLIQGKVRINDGPATQLLSPGNRIVNVRGKLTNEPTDTDQATAWKSGRMYFSGADIYSIMRQVSRWYNVDVQYVGEMPTMKFASAAFKRNSKLSTIITALQDNFNINTKIIKSSQGTTTLIVTAN